MGVIKRAENLFEIRTTLSEETLYVPSSDEDEVIPPQFEIESQRRQPPRVLKPRPPPVGPIFSNLKNHSGKKKFRRFHNANQLIRLAEEDELHEITIDDFIVSSKSPFSVLLEDAQSYEKWDKFVSSSEEKQQELLEEKKKKKNDYGKQPFLSKALRSLLRKKNLPIGMLQYLEQELISFFSAQPTQTYISPALSSFERLLLHSVSNYHRLASLSGVIFYHSNFQFKLKLFKGAETWRAERANSEFNILVLQPLTFDKKHRPDYGFLSEPENLKLVRVKNPRKEFPSPPLLLAQYLEVTYGTH